MVKWTIVAVVAAAVALTAAGGTAAAGDRDAFVESSGSSAQPSQEQYGVPASVTVAQAILESGWGESELAREANNYFGMKCHDKDPGPVAAGCVEHDTRECDDDGCFDVKDWFRSYDSVADSFADHGRKLYESSRYDKAFDYTDDADKFISEVHKAGYATDPDYTDKVVTLMREHDLYRFNAS
ncbi:MAG: sporangiospore maturation cell wall hydrolase GsmA [Stackebrandtia sp.]